MPQSAIASGFVDFVLPVDEMGEKLVEAEAYQKVLVQELNHQRQLQ